VCQLDALGVPRCNGLGTDCRKPAENCASAADCCDQAPCVPDGSGVLRCHSTSCVPSAGPCTVNADCCPGSSCITQIGSTRGTCSVPPPPPGNGGATGAGGSGNGGASSAGGAGGTLGAGGANSGGAGGACSLYGQTCTTTANCCSGVPCTSGFCRFLIK
jgi:hypothetical protein